MDRSGIKKLATDYIDKEAPYWLKAESEDRESSIEELTKFAEKVLVVGKSLNRKCYCGNPVDVSDPDCDSFNLCKEHAADS